MKVQKIDLPTPTFDATTATRQEMLALVVFWWPRGSGPLSMCRVIVSMLCQISTLRGFEPFTSEEIEGMDYQKAREILKARGWVT